LLIFDYKTGQEERAKKLDKDAGDDVEKLSRYSDKITACPVL
jgi:hypothetical protein